MHRQVVLHPCLEIQKSVSWRVWLLRILTDALRIPGEGRQHFGYCRQVLLSFIASNNLYCYRHCGCPACVCVCVSVRSFLPPRASISRNIGTYVFTATWKTLYIGIIIVIFAENASFRSYSRRHLLAPNATNRS